MRTGTKAWRGTSGDDDLGGSTRSGAARALLIGLMIGLAGSLLGLAAYIALPPVLLESAQPEEARAETVDSGPLASRAQTSGTVQDTRGSDPTGIRVRDRLRRPGSGLSDAQIEELAAVIVEESIRHRLEPALVLAVIHVESSGRSGAVSPVGALGLMQIMPPTGEELAARHGIPWKGPKTLLDPVVNVKLGIAYLRKLTDRYQNVSTALTAYNWGPGRIDRRLRAGESLPTVYSDRVMRAYNTTKREIAVGRS